MNLPEDSDSLTDEQAAAVESSDKVIAILAGPGSGKTRTLCERAKFLLERDGGASALLLTFMNKAAAEMKARALQTTRLPTERILASTFHTFGLRLLETHGSLVGVDSMDVLEAPESEEIISSLATSLGMIRPDKRHWEISTSRLRDRPLSGQSEGLLESYTAHKRELGVVDFDDLVVLTADVLTDHPEIAESWALRYPHLLVDEFQDTNAVQFRIVRALAAHSTSVTVVADDDQAIMRFAGADSQNVSVFVSELGASVFPLSVNHRCKSQIVETANRLIARDPRASGREMSWLHEGGSVEISVHDNLAEEASQLAKDAASKIEGGLAPEDLAILARTTSRTDEVVAALELAGLPIDDWRTAVNTDETRQAVACCLAFLRTDLSARMIERAERVLAIAGEGSNAQSLLEQNIDIPQASELSELRNEAFAGLSPSEIVDRVQSVLSFDEALAERVSDIKDQVAAFESYDSDFSTEDLLGYMSLGMPSHGAPTDGGGIKVSTLHRTKGLEWPHVWIVGLEDDTLPFYYARSSEEIRDERRLLFVGICRAEDSLVLSRVTKIGRWSKAASRFLDEI